MRLAYIDNIRWTMILAKSFHEVDAPPLLKALLLTASAAVVTYLASALLLRKSPGLRQVL